jgi:hypothetical protein
MKASYMNDAGDIAIIRPLCYVRESMTREFSYSAGLPVCRGGRKHVGWCTGCGLNCKSGVVT